MAFEELLVQERLQKPGDLIRFDGEWGQPYTNTLFRVTQAMTTNKVSEISNAVPGVQTVVDVDAQGLNPDFALWCYEVRIGVSQGLVKLYSKWPSNDFTRQLQDPNFSIDPADPIRKMIGYSDWISTPANNPLFKWFWVKDELPSFIAMMDAPTTPAIFEKISLRFIVNILGLEPETNPDVLAGVANGNLFVSQAQHWELQGRRIWTNG